MQVVLLRCDVRMLRASAVLHGRVLGAVVVVVTVIVVVVVKTVGNN